MTDGPPPSPLAHTDVGDGPAVVFLHGMGSDRSRWQPVTDLLVDHLRCVSVDLPGHGGSSDDRCGAGPAVGAVHELVEALHLQSPVIVGHSLGGVVALVYGALFEPRSVVAVDPVPLHLPHLVDSLAPYRDRLLGDDFAAAFAEWESQLDAGPMTPDQHRQILGGVHPRAAVVRAWWRALLDPTATEDVSRNFEGALTALHVPTLLWLAGAPTLEDAALLARMPTATVEVFPGRGHWLHLLEPPAFADRLTTWISARPA